MILSALVDFFFFFTGPEGVILGAGGTAELALSSSAKMSAGFKGLNRRDESVHVSERGRVVMEGEDGAEMKDGNRTRTRLTIREELADVVCFCDWHVCP